MPPEAEKDERLSRDEAGFLQIEEEACLRDPRHANPKTPETSLSGMCHYEDVVEVDDETDTQASQLLCETPAQLGEDPRGCTQAEAKN